MFIRRIIATITITITITVLSIVQVVQGQGQGQGQGQQGEQGDGTIDYTCNARLDYQTDNKCLSIANGVCDDPNFNGNGGNDCIKQDCIDCNIQCQKFDTDCYGCLNAKGCYYCPGDGTCENSDEYSSSNKDRQCTTPNDYYSLSNGNIQDECISNTAYYKDPLWDANLWVYESINVEDVWSMYGYEGEGIVIRINDDGVDVTNKEFDGRFDIIENSCIEYLPLSDIQNDDGHGTAVAGIILANSNNNLCSAGIASKSKFSSCNFFANNVPYSSLAYKINTFDISQNSIGMPACSEAGLVGGAEGEINGNGDDGDNIEPIRIYEECPFTYSEESKYSPCEVCGDTFIIDEPLSVECENSITNHCKEYYKLDQDACTDFPEIIIGGDCDYNKLPQSAVQALELGIKQGRNGKGIVFVFASGNDFIKGDDVNFSGWTNSRFTITVGAIGKNGLHADYSTPGSALVVSAPGGGTKDVGHLMTAGLGVNQCADSGQGTSFACPVVSGVIALMLEARTELSWRDVQGIIAKTSKRVINDPLDESVVVNGAGYWHSRWYGFGVINALAAVEAALEWELYTEEEQVIGMSKEENAVLSDDPNSNDNIYTSTIKITKKDSAEDFLTESTVVLLDLKHYNRGDLEIILTSPSGTESLLHPNPTPEDTQLEESERWKLMTVRNIGESPIGVWSLSVRDLVDRSNNPNIVDENIFRQWKLIVYGRSISTSASSSGDGDVDGGGNGPADEGVGEDEESPEADKQSQFCLDQKNGGGSVFECGITSDGNNSCPAGTVLSFGDESRTVDANILCPLDITLGQNIDYIAASQKGLCECDASLYDTNCDQITFDEELTCGCFVCPTGSTLVVSYSCNKPIIDNCLTFDCDGKCNGLYQPPLLEIITTNRPTTFPTTAPTKSPTNVPTNDPTKEPTKAPTVSPTKNSSKAPKTTEPPTAPPTKQDVIIVNPDPTNSPTKEIGITTTEDEESQVQQQKPPSGQPIEQPVMQPIAQPLGEQFGGDDEDVNDSNNNNTNTGDDGDEEQQQQDTTIENVSCEKSFSIDSDTIMEGSITKFPPVVDVEGTCLSGLETVGGWYEMVGNGNIYTLSACSMDPSKSVGINVFTAGDNANDDDDKCSDLICIENQSRQVANCGSEDDDNNTNNNGYAISWVSESEKTYHVLVSGLPIGVGSSSGSRRLLEPNQDNYDYELQFSEEEIPLNTECKLSFPVPFKEPVEGRTVGDDSIATVYDTCKETKRSGVWYTFSDGKPNDGILVYQANTCSTETNFNNEISIFRGNDCDSLECVNIDVMPCQKNGEYGEMAYWTTSIEETFHIFVHAAENNNNDNNIIDGGSNIATSGFDAGHFSMDISYADRKGNDQCGAAIPINIDQDELTGNTDGTKPDMASIIGSSCGIGGAGAWYRVTGNGSTFQASTCSGKTDHQTSMYVYTGQCGSLACIDYEGGNEVLCSDPNTADKSSTLNFKTQEGIDYYILVTGRRGTTGNFGLKISEVETSSNNECEQAELLNLDNSAVQGSTLQATVDFPPDAVCGVTLDSPGIWYSVEGTGRGVELSTCQSNNFDTAISVFKGSSCGDLECVTGTSAEDPSCDTTGVTAAWLTESNTKYHIYVHGKSSPSNMGDFELTATEFDVIETNEFCPQANLVPADGSRIQGSTEDATHAAIHSSSCGVEVVNPGLWYLFKGNGQPFSISACAEDEEDFDVSVSVFTGTCDDLTCVTGSTFVDNYCSTSTARTGRRSLQQQVSSNNDFRFMTKSRKDYYVFVHGQDGVGDFDLFINEDIVPGFGTIAPTTTPGKFGKDLYRWIPINNDVTIVTDYPSLTIASPPTAGGIAKVNGSAIQYSSLLDYVGIDVISVEGCTQGDCYLFDITIRVMGDEENVGDDGWNKLWLLILLLLLCPCLCLPLYFFYQKKMLEKENEYEDHDDMDKDLDEFLDDLENSDAEGGQLLPYQTQNNDSSDDDDDWESSDGDGDDNSEENSDYSSDEDESSSDEEEEEEEDDEYEDNDGFDDE